MGKKPRETKNTSKRHITDLNNGDTPYLGIEQSNIINLSILPESMNKLNKIIIKILTCLCFPLSYTFDAKIHIDYKKYGINC